MRSVASHCKRKAEGLKTLSGTTPSEGPKSETPPRAPVSAPVSSSPSRRVSGAEKVAPFAPRKRTSACSAGTTEPKTSGEAEMERSIASEPPAPANSATMMWSPASA